MYKLLKKQSMTLVLMVGVISTAVVSAEGGFKLVGEGKLKVLMWNVYQSELYTPTGTYDDSTEELILKITYLRSIKNEDLVSQTLKQWDHLGLEKSAYAGFSQELKQLWPDVSKGDSLSMEVTTNETLFYFNGELTGSIDSPEFGPMFSSIWLSPNSSQPKLRRKLLGD